MKEIILRTGILTLALIINQASVSPSFAETLSIDSGYIDVAAGSIFYESAGNGPAIIMIHDGVLHRETWDAQFSAFAGSHRVIRWDRRGYGKSKSPNAPFSHLDDLLILMDTLEIKRATLLGCSSGGLLAIDFTLFHPERVSSLVLVGPIISGFGFSKHFNTRGGQRIRNADETIAEKIEYWAQDDQWIIAPENKVAKDRMEKLLTENPQNMIGSGRFARGPGRSAMDLLPEIKVPTLIIAGESDIPDVHTHIGVIQAGIEGSQRVVLANSGHLAHFEVPETFNQAVADFLEKSE